MNITFCGCGAIGSRIILETAHLFHEVLIIDDDEISENNIGTSAFYQSAIGAKKTTWLQEQVFFKYGKIIKAKSDTLRNPLYITEYWDSNTLVVDSFDNPEARILTRTSNTLHVGVGENKNGAVMWDEIYPEITIDYQRGYNPVCTNHLGQQLIQITAAVAIGVIINYLNTGNRDNFIVQENMKIVKI